MWTPPIAWSPEEQQRVARTQKARQFFVFLRPIRHELLDAELQQTLAQSYSPDPRGKAPVEGGLWALATLLQAYCHVGDRDAGELRGMDKRWQRGWDCLGADQPPFSQGTLGHFRRRLIAHTLDKTLLERTVAVAEKPGGFGARQVRVALDSTPLCGASRVEETRNRLGQALRQAVGGAARELGTSAEALVAEAGLVLVGQRSLKAALDLDWGAPQAREPAVHLVVEEVDRWARWLEQQHPLSAHEPPLQEMRDTIGPRVAPDTEPDPTGGPGGRRIKKPVAPDRRLSLEDPAMRHGRKSRSNTFNGFKEHWGVDLDSTVTREVVVRPAHEPEHEVVEWLATEVERPPGLLQLDIDWGEMASPRIGPWAAPGGSIMARPWPGGGALLTKPDCTLDCTHRTVTWPGGQPTPMIPGRTVQFPARACDMWPQRAQCTTAKLGQGRTLTMREEEPFQQQLRATLRTKRGRAARRKRTAVEQAIAHQLAPQGRRARYKGLRKNPCDGRRHAAGSNLQVAARYAEEHQLAS